MSQALETPTSVGEAATALAPARAAPPATLIQLNAFQILMRRWSRLHPYNAGQVMRVSGPPDKERWKLAIESVIGELGLGKPRFLNSDHSVQFAPAGDLQIEQSKQDLQTFFNEELNRPFAVGDLPIRFCLLPGVPDSGNDRACGSHYLAAVYDHWIADSRAMRELMHRIFHRYQYPEAPAGANGSPASRLPALTLEAPNFATLFRKYVGRLTRLAAIRESLKNIWRHRHSFRLNLWDPLDFNSRFVLRQLPDGLIERLYHYAKARGSSVNDLFIAVAAQSMGAFTVEDRVKRPSKPFHFCRQEVGIGTIVDIRDYARQPLDRVFNLYLSSYTVLLHNPENRSAEDLMKEAVARTAEIKKSRATVKGFWALVMARLWYDLYDSPKFQATLLHKTVPVVAGISNVNMSGSWADPAPAEKISSNNGHPASPDDLPQIEDYLRISPTGPLIPLVFTLTTIRDRLSLCVTYRATTFHEPKLLQLVDDFIRRLEAIAPESS